MTDNEIIKASECLADYLLENGVVVLPCKVGDTVHCLYQPPKEKNKNR